MEDFEEVGWARSATKHGISRTRSIGVVDRAASCFEEESSDRDVRLWFFGDDRDGIPLEVIGVETSAGALLVIHAMPLRARHRARYEEVKRWQERRDIQ